MRIRLAVALLAVIAVLTQTARPSAFHHFELIKSAPAAKSTIDGAVTSVRVQLWFTQVPAAGVSRLALKGPSGDLALGKTVIVPKDKAMYADAAGPLPAGAYTIQWRGAGDDGHVQQGTIPFTVSGQ
jgi:methionine-rich copper-binding protein CopC